MSAQAAAAMPLKQLPSFRHNNDPRMVAEQRPSVGPPCAAPCCVIEQSSTTNRTEQSAN